MIKSGGPRGVKTPVGLSGLAFSSVHHFVRDVSPFGKVTATIF
jgi:hypothetical protein